MPCHTDQECEMRCGQRFPNTIRGVCLPHKNVGHNSCYCYLISDLVNNNIRMGEPEFGIQH